MPAFEIAPAGAQLTVSVELTADWDTTRWTATDAPVPAAHLLLNGRRRGTPQRLAMQLQPADGGSVSGHGPRPEFRGSALLDPALIEVGEQICDMYVEVSCEATARRVRLRSQASGNQDVGGAIVAAVPGGEVFATGHGNVSLRLAE